MPLLASTGGGSAKGFGALANLGYFINNSLRFRRSASPFLSRTPASTGSRRKVTHSFWIKRGQLGTLQRLVGVSDNLTGDFILQWDSSNRFEVYETNNTGLITTQVFRDPAAWYHIVVAFDTTQATSSDRVKLYINGSQVTSLSTATYPSLNADLYQNQASIPARIGIWPSGSDYADGYLAEYHHIDGQQLTPSSFGKTDTGTGQWVPKKFAGIYGTNGYYLKFSDIALTSGSNAGLGKDFSGNGNYWNTNNISVTAGVTYDAMIDSPTLSAAASNYCVWNPLRTSSATITNANLTVAQSSAAYVSSTGTFGVSSGKWYWETFVVNQTSILSMGITNVYNVNGITTGIVTYHAADGTKYLGSENSAYGSSFTTNDIIGFALDMDAGTLTCYKNNTSQGVIATGLSGTYYPYVTMYSTNSISSTFGQRPFSYTPPTGFKALNAFNLP
jgi:hypothetical protein